MGGRVSVTLASTIVLTATVLCAVDVSDGAGGSIHHGALDPVHLVQYSTKAVLDSSFYEFAPWLSRTADNSYTLSVGFLSFLNYSSIGDEAPRIGEPSVTPSTAPPGTAFRFRAVYRDEMGDPPLPDGVRVHLRDGDALVTSTAGVILHVDTTVPAGTPLTGIVFTGVVSLHAPSDRYNFTIEARDIFGFSTSTPRMPGPFVDTPPQLLFAGDQEYADRHIRPDTGDPTTEFRVRIRYADADNHLPAPGSPRVVVRRQGIVVKTQTLALASSDLPVNGILFETVLSSFATYGFHECTVEAADAIGLSTAVQALPGITVVSVPQVVAYVPAQRLAPETTYFLSAVVTCADGHAPAAGYPRACVSLNGSTVAEGVAEYIGGGHSSGAQYRFPVRLSTVSAGYHAEFMTAHPSGFGGVVRSSPVPFAVTSGPFPPVSTTVYDDPVNNVTLTSRCRLSWRGETPDRGTTLTYRLYCGVDQPSHEPLYTGQESHFTMTTLEPGRRYVWAVSATDDAGATARSVEYAFSTLAQDPQRVFNYPNPFNPHRGATAIVYTADAPGDAELRIYTERGELRYQASARAVPGSNSFPYDGRDRDGRVLDNGSYIYTITLNGTKRTGILLVLKRS